MSSRKLYTDFDEVVLEVQRPVIITSINEVATRGDLLDRTISIALPPMPAERRRTESALWADFDQALPGMLGGLLDAVSNALCDRSLVQLEQPPRLADFVTWVEAAAPALGWPEDRFAQAFASSRRDLDAVALESEAIGPAILALMEANDTWSGTATELLEILGESASADLRKERTWPRGASQAAKRLDRITPNLRRMDIDVQRSRIGAAGTRHITLTRSCVGSECQARQARQSRQEPSAAPAGTAQPVGAAEVSTASF